MFKKKSVILILFIFVTLVYSLPNPNKPQNGGGQVGEIAIVDFLGLPDEEALGRAVFTQITQDTCRATMQWNEGFTSGNPDDYKFNLDHIDITSDIRPHLLINPPGTAPIEIEFSTFTCLSLVGRRFKIKRKNETI
ncbi:4934_t:CDS:1, partial [Cetraspora pellucida]